MTTTTHLWLRAEVKPFEHRTPVTPEICKRLIESGFKITVEKSTDRCIPDSEYASAGCELVEGGTWKNAPTDAFVFGVKELPENDDSPLKHHHIYFGHCFKNQTGWKELLKRFRDGNGVLLDLEFLNDAQGRRVAAFGYMAGYAGSALGIDVWCERMINGESGSLGRVSPYPNDEELKKHLRDRLAKAKQTSGRLPRILVIGALGRCGTGACDLAVQVGLPEDHIVRWDLAETKAGGPFPQLLDVDILVNCIYLSQKIPPFITMDMLRTTENRALTVVVDVSCDYTSANNPIPIYDMATTFDAPTVCVEGIPSNQLREIQQAVVLEKLTMDTFTVTSSPALDIVSIDHLPTLLPLESSQRFAADLLPTLLELPNWRQSRVWGDAYKLFEEKLNAAAAAS